jgi:hypothetical protein
VESQSNMVKKPLLITLVLTRYKTYKHKST